MKKSVKRSKKSEKTKKGVRPVSVMRLWSLLSFFLALIYLVMSLVNIETAGGGFTSFWFYVLYIVVFVLLIVPLYVFGRYRLVELKTFIWWGRIASIFYILMIVVQYFVSPIDTFLISVTVVMVLLYVPVFYRSWRHFFIRKKKK
jgi:hypothetical protein